MKTNIPQPYVEKSDILTEIIKTSRLDDRFLKSHQQIDPCNIKEVVKIVDQTIYNLKSTIIKRKSYNLYIRLREDRRHQKIIFSRQVTERPLF